ncbi:MAG: hypothetical protein NZ879_00280 [Archaeoglobaceae archaeon]|nr:hypothetical protein [Archaeoglobaceae archaeon]MDW8117405.1 hypothetical protein [Archaeoglobaceae archaeon]
MELVCKSCGKKINVDEKFSILECGCGAYYRKSRDFSEKWVFAGFGKATKEKSKEELETKEEKEKYEVQKLRKKKS